MAASAPVSDPGHTGTDARARTGNLALRLASAAVLAPLALGTAFVGGWAFALFWTLAAVAVFWEWTALVADRRYRLLVFSGAGAVAAAGLLADRGRMVAAALVLALGALAAAVFAPRGRRLWILGGVGYAGSMLLTPMILRSDPAYGFFAILFLFVVVWTTDVLGYVGGRACGGPRLAPAISPNKTWAGAASGTLGAMAVTAIGVHVLGGFDISALVTLALVLSIAAQLGDLMESRIKRQFGAKDASRLIPGHGGVMDRLDGFWAAALTGCLIGLARGGLDAAARGLLVW